MQVRGEVVDRDWSLCVLILWVTVSPCGTKWTTRFISTVWNERPRKTEMSRESYKEENMKLNGGGGKKKIKGKWKCHTTQSVNGQSRTPPRPGFDWRVKSRTCKWRWKVTSWCTFAANYTFNQDSWAENYRTKITKKKKKLAKWRMMVF